MSNEDAKPVEVGPEPTPAAKTLVSLSQVLLAPLDAIFKAQMHAARSFLNLLLQLAYPDVLTKDKDGKPIEKPTSKVYTEKFLFEGTENGRPIQQQVSVPTLALVPIQPLAVQEATFNLKMAVSMVAEHEQMRPSSDAPKSARPWYLVKKPLSIRGYIAPAEGPEDSKGTPAGTIEISVKIAPVHLPSGLDKLLTVMTQKATVEPPQNEGETPSTPQLPK